PAALQFPPLWWHFVNETAWQEARVRSHSAIERLKFMFRYSMGAPDYFNLQRAELADRRGLRPDQVDDQAVYTSFIDEMRPGGMMNKLLHFMQMSLRLGMNQIVHGGLTPESLEFMRQLTPNAATLDHEFAGLTRWYQEGLRLWDQSWGEWQPPGARPAEALL